MSRQIRRVQLVVLLLPVAFLLSGCGENQDSVQSESQTVSQDSVADQSAEVQPELRAELFSVSPSTAQRTVSGDMGIDGIVTLGGRPTSRVVRRDSVLAIASGRAVRFYDHEPGSVIGATEYDSPVRDLGAGARGFFVLTDTTVEAFTPTEGQQWTVELPVLPSTGLVVTTSSLYLGLSDGSVLALGVDQGRQRFLARPGRSPVLVLQIASGSIFLVDDESTIRRLDATTGDQLWSANLPGRFAAPLTASGRQVALATTDGRAIVLDAENGESLLPAEVGSLESDWAVLSNEQLVLVSDSRIESIDPVTGESGWRIDRAGDLAIDPFTVGVTLFLAEADSLHSYSPSGRRISTVNLPGVPVSSPQLFSDTLLLPLASGEIVEIAVNGSEAELPLLGSGRTWQLPPGGEFRLRDRDVALSLRSAVGGVFDITVTSIPVRDLLLTVVEENGRRVATNMGKVELDQTVRASLEPGQLYRLEIVRPGSGQEIEVAVTTDRVD